MPSLRTGVYKCGSRQAAEIVPRTRRGMLLNAGEAFL
jgi:hypothetical protein